MTLMHYWRDEIVFLNVHAAVSMPKQLFVCFSDILDWLINLLTILRNFDSIIEAFIMYNDIIKTSIKSQNRIMHLQCNQTA
jgi:hypothetical protein